ncbi:MAG: hypothetical protein ACHQ5A_06715 [Opitutales bacterium]
MKKYFLLSLVSISLTVAGAQVATTAQNPSETIRLETYRVEAPRQTEGERSLQQGLDELKATARTPLSVQVQPSLPVQSTDLPQGNARLANRTVRVHRAQS